MVVVAGARAVAGHPEQVPIGALGHLGDGLGPATLALDRLSGLFAVITFSAAATACLAGVRGRDNAPRATPAAVSACLVSVLMILTSTHVFVLLFGWEALTLSFFLLTGLDRRNPDATGAAVTAATFGKASGAAVLLGGLLAAHSGGGMTFADLAGAHGPVADVAFALLLLGFGIKVGIVPVHVWLPRCYAAAPGPARAIMAGSAVNAGFYGMWRALDLLGPPPAWLAITVLSLAGLTAVLGIAHAAVHPDLRGLVAWSSVENAGVIAAGFGVAMVGSSAGNQRLLAVGLLAATAQVIAHAVAKSLLFVVVRDIEDAYGTCELDQLRGVARARPWAGAGLVVGALTLAGLPLTAGFASEWLTLESLMQQFRIDHLGMQLASATAAALVALSIGVAGVAFVRLIALTGFGGGRALHTREPTGLRASVLLLLAGCLGTAMVAPWEVDLINAGLRSMVGRELEGAHASALVIQPVFPGFSALSPTLLWVVIPSYALLLAVTMTAVTGSRLLQVRRVPVWASASPGVDRGIGYTSFGYANPLRKVFANLLLTHHQIEEVATGERDTAARLASERTGAPTVRSDDHVRTEALMTYDVDVVEVVERYLYRPAYRVLNGAARCATRLQSGRLDAYVTYLLIVLLAVIAVVAATS
ncbi:MAG TPA: proton-conducting transporter membrane subunit [Marmoricola sp.]|nr:proton-conducting transporter membrane subunit [Marmoricola sp.]